ncbi:MAG: hypothetical protein ABI067_05665 [Leifsonia sp.]
MAKKYLITSTIVFEVESEDTAEAAATAFLKIENKVFDPENIQVWDKSDTAVHFFADRYTYEGTPQLIEPNPQGPVGLDKPKPKVEAKVEKKGENKGEILAVDMPMELDTLDGPVNIGKIVRTT